MAVVDVGEGEVEAPGRLMHMGRGLSRRSKSATRPLTANHHIATHLPPMRWSRLLGTDLTALRHVLNDLTAEEYNARDQARRDLANEFWSIGLVASRSRKLSVVAHWSATGWFAVCMSMQMGRSQTLNAKSQ